MSDQPNRGGGVTTRTHISKAVVSLLEARPVDTKRAIKPGGFWYEVDGDWRRWCESEMADWIEGAQLYKVEIGSDVRLLRIATLEEFDAFHREYVIVEPYPGARTLYPDWKRVATRFDGIEIAPYQWDRRMDFGTFWYYGWDCASGVLWEPRNTTVELVGPVVRATPEDADGR